jgi:hypothetical protein
MRPANRYGALALSALLLFGAGKSLQLHLETRALLKRSLPKSIGMGDSLRTMAEGLERELAERLAYQAPERRDPLALRRVVRAPVPSGRADEAAEAGRMRLSATLVSAGTSVAIIKYQGRSHTLHLGDTLDQRVVKSIDKRTVTLDFLGKSVVLVNEPAPKTEIQTEGGKRRLEDLQL